jgi:hypothetical protein
MNGLYHQTAHLLSTSNICFISSSPVPFFRSTQSQRKLVS